MLAKQPELAIRGRVARLRRQLEAGIRPEFLGHFASAVHSLADVAVPVRGGILPTAVPHLTQQRTSDSAAEKKGLSGARTSDRKRRVSPAFASTHSGVFPRQLHSPPSGRRPLRKLSGMTHVGQSSESMSTR